MKMPQKMKIIAAILAMLSLAACGTSSSSSGFGSATAATSTTPTGASAVATCSKDMGNLSDFQILLEYTKDQLGNLQPSLVQVAIAASPADWATSNYDLQFYRWAVSTSNVATPLSLVSFQFERSYGSGTYHLLTDNQGNAPSYQVINASEITTYAQVTGITSSSPQAVMSQAHFLVNVQDSTGAYQVIRAVLRDKTTHAVYRQVDALIPTFYANPATYNSQHPALLQALHPLQSYNGQGWSESQYQSFMNGFCF